MGPLTTQIKILFQLKHFALHMQELLQINSHLHQSDSLQEVRHATTPSMLWSDVLLHLLQVVQV